MGRARANRARFEVDLGFGKISDFGFESNFTPLAPVCTMTTNFTGTVVPAGYTPVPAAEIDKKGDTSVPGIPILEGWEKWLPPTPETYHADHLPVFEIVGTDAQIVQFPVRPGRSITCFSGAMCYMSPGMQMEAKLAGTGKMFGRLVGGGSLFQLTYTNETGTDGYISCTPDYPGVIVPIHMKECPSGRIIAQRDSFLCATFGMGDISADVSGGFNPASSVVAKCCSGIDFIVQTISNGDWSFLVAMGTVIQKVGAHWYRR